MSNELLRDFLARLEARYAKDRVGMSMSQWICENTTLKKRPFSFKSYPFQAAIADDMHPRLAVIKCAQVGLTEVQIRKFFAILRRFNGTVGIFTLPNEKMFKRASKTRMRPILLADPVFTLEGEENATRSMDLYQIGDSFGYVTGCTEGDATSISADFLFHDELDLSPMNMIGLFQSRLQNSDMKITQKFSTPTHLEYGIDAEYRLTDQREYLIKCAACGHWQLPLFDRKFVHIPGLPDDVQDLTEINEIVVNQLDLKNAYVHCERCFSRLDLGDGDNREWVATYPDRQNYRGYYVRPFSTNRITVEYIVNQLIEYTRKEYRRGFFNTVLGQPYTDGTNRLADYEIRACLTSHANVPDISSDTPVMVGIDIGQTCHIVLGHPTPGGGAHAFYWEALPVNDLLERVEQISKTYRLVAGAVDRHPYTPTAEALMNLTGGKIVPVEYRGAQPINVVKDKRGVMTHVQAHRTTFLDRVARFIRRRLLEISGYNTQLPIIISHLRDLVRDEQPEEEARWIKLTGNDHFFHALGAMLFAQHMKEFLDGVEEVDVRSSVLVTSAMLHGDAHIGLARPNKSGRISLQSTALGLMI